MIYFKIAAVLAAALSILAGAHWLVKQGEKTAVTRIERVNNDARRKADEAERDVMNCPPGKWSREHNRCDR